MKKIFKKKIKLIFIKKGKNYKILKKNYIQIKIYKKLKKKIKILKIKKNLYFFILKKKKLEEILIEIKSGVGGEESSMFVKDLYKMYLKFFKNNNWKIKIINISKSNINGIKDVLINIKGFYVYNRIKFEAGVHRIQRNPKNDKKGRIHTSTCKVAIFKNLNRKSIKIKKKDLIISSFKSSGSGGQHVNNTNSAIRIIHSPTNISVECQDERNQHVNKKKALKILKLKILIYNIKKMNNIKNKKIKLMIGKGGRSEKIRTYNYNKNKIIEHRINFSIDLNIIMNNGYINLINNNFKNYLCTKEK